MKIQLQSFDYHFTMTGRVRNLFSIECEFLPMPAAGTSSEAEAKSAARGLVETYNNMLGRVFEDLVKGSREPFLRDSPHNVTAGYKYEGYIKKQIPAVLKRRARVLFPWIAVHDQRVPSAFMQLEASIECSFKKRGKDIHGGNIAAKFQLRHMLNLCLYEFTKRLEDIEVASNARESMDRLEHTLAVTLRQGEQDYLRLITE